MQKLICLFFFVPILGMNLSSCATPESTTGSTLRTEFLFDSAPFPSVHASTLVETAEGIVAAWFGGTREGDEDVGICMSMQVSGEWSDHYEVASGLHPDCPRF